MGIAKAEIPMESLDLLQRVRSNIESALVQKARTDAGRIYIEVSGNRVTLNGTVSSFAEQREVIKAARSVPGVGVVENRLAVTIA